VVVHQQHAQWPSICATAGGSRLAGALLWEKLPARQQAEKSHFEGAETGTLLSQQ
jgi:hypothetical protein